MTDIANRFDAGSWEFTPEVARVFDEHVAASVPHYGVFQQLAVEAADWLLPRRGVLADLGASTGTTAAAIANRHPEREIEFHLYDESAAMLNEAKAKLPSGHFHVRRIEHGAELEHERADLTLALFTLQFLPYATREVVLRRAKLKALPTGALLVAEKIRIPDSRWAEIAADLSHDWKAEHGISDEAIRAKARSLRGVLRPASLNDLLATIERAGWQRPEIIFRWHSWCLVGAFAG